MCFQGGGRSSSNGEFDKGINPSTNYVIDDFDNYSEGSQSETYSRDTPQREYNREGRDSRERERDRDMRDREGREARDNHRDRDYSRDEKGGERWMTANPTNTILLRGLVPQIDEKDVSTCIVICPFCFPFKKLYIVYRHILSILICQLK